MGVAYKIWEQIHHQRLLEEEWLSNLEDYSHRVQQQVEEGSKQVWFDKYDPLPQEVRVLQQSLAYSLRKNGGAGG